MGVKLHANGRTAIGIGDKDYVAQDGFFDVEPHHVGEALSHGLTHESPKSNHDAEDLTRLDALAAENQTLRENFSAAQGQITDLNTRLAALEAWKAESTKGAK